MPPRPEPLLPAAGVPALRAALADFTADGVADLLGPAGGSAHRRGDLLGVERLLDDSPLATLVRLFLLGLAVDAVSAREALAPLPLDSSGALLECDGERVRARVEIRPHAADGTNFWVVSDFGSDVRPGPLDPEHVLGIGAASLTLAQAAIRSPVARALDLGTGCGLQALHLSAHARTVTGTDVSPRALRFAATTAALNGMSWDLRPGSLLEPVAGERYDLVVANPPFVVSPGLDAGSGGHTYRDSGLAGDGVTEHLLRGLPSLLAEGGSAQLLANWIIPTGSTAWPDRLAGWLAGGGCDAWVWQREVAEPGEYVTLWLRDAGHRPGSAAWRAQYTRWLDWFAAAGVAAVGMGLVALWRSAAPPGAEILRFEDVPQPVVQPVGALLPGWIERQRWLAGHDDVALVGARLRAGPGVVRAARERPEAGGWETTELTLVQEAGLRWEVPTDAAVSALVAGCDGTAPLGLLLDLLATAEGAPVAAVTAAALPVVRDLIERGFLEPVSG